MHNPEMIFKEINNKFEKLNRPVKIKNYANNKYAYPPIFFGPYTSFYDNKTLNISHSYYNKKIIKKPSFPYFLPHYDQLKSLIDKEKDKKNFFNEECELIKKTDIICGNIILNEEMIYFISNNEKKKNMEKI